MSKTRTTCSCGCSTQKKVLTVTQIDNTTVLEPENLANRDNILVMSKNINGAYMVKVMSGLTVKDLVKAIDDPDVAFLLTEMKEPPAPADPDDPSTENPADPAPVTPENPEEPGDTEQEGTEDGGDND